jgi:hypothetical protein
MFHVDAFLHRYITHQSYNRWRSAATFFVTGARRCVALGLLYYRKSMT